MNNPLKNHTDPIFFVTPDPHWGIGLEDIIPNYHIVCLDNSPVVPLLRVSGVNIFCLEEFLNEKIKYFEALGICCPILKHKSTSRKMQVIAG